MVRPTEEGRMRDDYQRGVLASEKKNLNSSEIAERDKFNEAHPPNKGLVVADDLRKMELPARPWRNNRGHYFDLADYEVLGAHISELMPGNKSVRHRHTTEAYLYVVKGHGYSLVNFDDEPIEVVEWQGGTPFAPPAVGRHPEVNAHE